MDAKLIYKDISPAAGWYDLSLVGADLQNDNSLETAVILSLFTDRRAASDDILPDGSDDRRGYWADRYADAGGDRFGSRLWLLAREKQLPGVANRAREYAEEALTWLVDDGIAERIVVTTEIPRPGVLRLIIDIYKPGGTQVGFKFSDLWAAL